MLELDGSAGGGQLVRTALALSAVSGQPFRMTDVRGSRSTPGLRPQHLAAVRALADVSDAAVSGEEDGAGDRDDEAGSDDGGGAGADGDGGVDCDGAGDEDGDGDGETDGDGLAVGTRELVFEPGDVEGGEYAVDVGTAGSLTLLFDAVLPLATALESPLALWATGGTDVKWSPPADYLERVKLPLLREFGLQAAVEVDRRGFYPKGAGEATLYVAPSRLDPIAVDADPAAARVYSVAAEDLAERDVADRQAAAAVEALEAAGVAVVERRVTYAATASPGSAVVVRLDGAPAGFDALGERGTPSEAVGREAAEAALAFGDGPGAVDAHMADQLVPFLALAGGEVRIPRVTDHVETSVELVRSFGYDVVLEELSAGGVLRG